MVARSLHRTQRRSLQVDTSHGSTKKSYNALTIFFFDNGKSTTQRMHVASRRCIRSIKIMFCLQYIFRTIIYQKMYNVNHKTGKTNSPCRICCPIYSWYQYPAKMKSTRYCHPGVGSHRRLGYYKRIRISPLYIGCFDGLLVNKKLGNRHF